MADAASLIGATTTACCIFIAQFSIIVTLAVIAADLSDRLEICGFSATLDSFDNGRL